VQSCLICDDHALVREALATIVAVKWPEATIATAVDFRAAWAQMARGPDLCLADLDMPGAAPLAGIDGLRAAAPATPILVFTGSFTDAMMLTLLGRGVAGFVPKTATTAVLASAIELVVAGGRYLPERLAQLTVAPLPPAQWRAPPPLSGRQVDVVRLIAQGQSNKDIARALDITPATVKTHVAQIIAAMGAANRTDAAMRARSLGLI
jgi:DNA-binding NarL/FixJ family response regulator